jgi:hypothetical protein
VKEDKCRIEGELRRMKKFEEAHVLMSSLLKIVQPPSPELTKQKPIPSSKREERHREKKGSCIALLSYRKKLVEFQQRRHLGVGFFQGFHSTER